MHHTHDTVQLSYTLNEITHMLTFEKKHIISMNAIIAANSGTCTKPSFIKDMFSSAHFRAEAHELWHNMFRAESERIEFQRQTKHSAMLKAQADNDPLTLIAALDQRITDLEVPPKQATKYYVGNAQTNVYEMVDNKSIAECCLCIEAFDTMWPVDSTQRTRWFIGFTGIDGKEQLVSVSTLMEAKKAANDNTRPGYMWPKIRIVCFREST